jgi:hypothetical protein
LIVYAAGPDRDAEANEDGVKHGSFRLMPLGNQIRGGFVRFFGQDRKKALLEWSWCLINCARCVGGNFESLYSYV